MLLHEAVCCAFVALCFFLIGIHSMRAEQPLRGMEFEKKHKKIKAYRKSV